MQLGNEKVVDMLIQNGANINFVAKDGATPLHAAAENGYENITNTLIQNGANINARNKLGFTPIHLAAAKGAI